jgi:hypothetical protein
MKHEEHEDGNLIRGIFFATIFELLAVFVLIGIGNIISHIISHLG